MNKFTDIWRKAIVFEVDIRKESFMNFDRGISFNFGWGRRSGLGHCNFI